MSTMIGRAALAVACATMVFGTSVRAGAGALAPAKASDIVVGVITPSSPPCPDGSLHLYQMALQLDSDGTRRELVIPPKSVLVVTRFSYSSFKPSGPNQFGSATLFVVEPVPAAQTPVPSALDGAISDAGGSALGSSEIPDGIVVKPPAVLCAALPDGIGETGTIIVNGFFAKSK